jgi:hypothetical protein
MPLLSSNFAVCKKAAIAMVMLWVAVGQGLLQAQVLPQPSSSPSTTVTAKLGGLMLSPIQRQNLEYVRSTGHSLPGAEQTADQLLNTTVGLSKTLTISGVVIRSGNRSTVWVNNQALYGQSGENALRAQAVPVGVLKPGQTIDVKTQQATDLLPPGAIKIIPPKASSTVKGKLEK